ncbi:presequence translocated-associated motor subunit PAM17 [Ephemerocybe angulata]|uniref:Presequence translocated-associated motor subunit PAM17 n=1 Tax=Ephemerocybe angulata TaxID=980116 RepID=A0A8H6IFY6_9AGAR|nr:presequence translocated-associated motor subunit PAM17 [Tulosesus angulatus]
MSIYIPRAPAMSLANARRTLVASSSRQFRGYATQVTKQENVNVESAKPLNTTPTRGLTWPEYLAIRRSRHRWQTVATIPAGLLGLSSGVAYFGNLETDPMKPIFGFDPFMVYGFLTACCMALLGPTIGGALWRFTHRDKTANSSHRIAKNRVDAALQTATAPVPDYYGERIGSLHDYRQWLRDQAKYRRKVLLPEQEE